MQAASKMGYKLESVTSRAVTLSVSGKQIEFELVRSSPLITGGAWL